MQFTSVIAVLSLALAASANPMNVERTGKETPGQQAQDKCGNTATAKCCNQKNGIIGSCNVINVASILPITSQCSATQVVACCQNSGSQSGLINLGSVCVPITL